MRATLLVSLAVTLPLAAQTPPSPPVPLPPPAPAPAPAVKRTLELTGLVLVNGFFTNARVNNSDVPQFADSLAPASAVGGTIRQTRLGLLVTEPDVLRCSFSAERSRRPYLQARVRLAWGPTDDPNEIAIGGHLGWLASADTLFQSRAVTADARFQVGSVELLAEAFSGKALAGLGGGGIGQSL